MSVDCHHTLSQVIKSFRHRGLRELYKDGRSARVSPGHITKIERILTALDRSDDPDGMDLPGENGGDKLVHGSGGISQPRAE